MYAGVPKGALLGQKTAFFRTSRDRYPFVAPRHKSPDLPFLALNVSLGTLKIGSQLSLRVS
jgi:hypothetical protein